MRQKRTKSLSTNNPTVYEPLSSPTDDQVTIHCTQDQDSNLSISPTSYSGCFSGTPIDPALAEWPLPEPHFGPVSNLDNMGQPCYGESEQMVAVSHIPDGVDGLFPGYLFPMGSGDSQPSQTLATNPGFNNSQAPNQLSITTYLSPEDYVVLDDEVVDSSSDFLDVGLDSGYPPLPTHTVPSRSDSANSSEWSYLMLESDGNGGDASQPRPTEILSIPLGGDSVPTTTTSGPGRTRRVRGQFKTPELREKTSQTRRMGACIRCRLQKVRVRFSPGKCL